MSLGNDAQKTPIKVSKGQFSEKATIGNNNIVGVETRDSNANDKFKQKNALEMFNTQLKPGKTIIKSKMYVVLYLKNIIYEPFN